MTTNQPADLSRGSAAIIRPSRADALLLGLAVLGVGASAPLVAAIAAPALAIALWRNAFGTAVLAPYAFARHWREIRAALADRPARRAVIVAAVALAGHFATWIPSITMTSVASATALAALQPVWSAVLAVIGGQHLNRRAWLGIGTAIAGMLVLTGLDIGVSREALVGDALALVGGMLAAVYVAAGARARTQLSTTSYASLAYGGCSVVLLALCLALGVPIVGFSAQAWALILVLTVSAQLIGHTLFNRALLRVGPVTVSVVILLEVPIAAIIAAWWLGQIPPVAAIPAAALVILGVALVVTSGTDIESEPPA